MERSVLIGLCIVGIVGLGAFWGKGKWNAKKEKKVLKYTLLGLFIWFIAVMAITAIFPKTGPGGIPLYPTAKKIEESKLEFGPVYGEVALYSYDGSVEAVSSWYKSEMPKHGWGRLTERNWDDKEFLFGQVWEIDVRLRSFKNMEGSFKNIEGAEILIMENNLIIRYSKG